MEKGIYQSFILYYIKLSGKASVISSFYIHRFQSQYNQIKITDVQMLAHRALHSPAKGLKLDHYAQKILCSCEKKINEIKSSSCYSSDRFGIFS